MDTRKKLVIMMVAALFLCAAMPAERGICEGLEAKVITSEDDSKAEMANNPLCPVSDDDIVREEAIMVEYDGKIYYVCCEACVKHFKKHPAKFVALAKTK